MTTDTRMIRCPAALACALLSAALPASAVTVVFFDTNQIATLVATGTTSDTISSEGYLFTYTRDKLFTGGVGLTNPAGRYVRVPWPEGVEAQAVTAGPNPGKARIILAREDGAAFDLTAFTARLLANTAGAGANIEIMPVREDGEDAWNDPAYFFASGYYGSQFSYDATPGYLGSTAALTNFHGYKISLYVDFALTSLVLVDNSPPSNHPPAGIDLSSATVFENEPAGTYIGTFTAVDPDASDTFTYTLVAGPGDTDNAMFTVAGDNLYAADPFNYEVRTNYTLRVEAADQGGLSVQNPFVVTILDVDEPPPAMDPPEVPADGIMLLRWTGLPNHTYTLLHATDLAQGFTAIYSNLSSPDLTYVITNSTTGPPWSFWMLSTEP